MEKAAFILCSVEQGVQMQEDAVWFGDEHENVQLMEHVVMEAEQEDAARAKMVANHDPVRRALVPPEPDNQVNTIVEEVAHCAFSRCRSKCEIELATRRMPPLHQQEEPRRDAAVDK